MIKLTQYNNRPVWIDPAAIIMIQADGMKTTLTLSSGSILIVTEDVEDVLALVRGGDTAGGGSWTDAATSRNQFSGFVK